MTKLFLINTRLNVEEKKSFYTLGMLGVLVTLYLLTFCNRSQPLVHKIEVHDPGLKCKKLKAFDLCGQMSDSFNLKLKLIIQAKED